jgi:hypothetical protein
LKRRNKTVVSILLIQNGILQKETKITKGHEGETRIDTNWNQLSAS